MANKHNFDAYRRNLERYSEKYDLSKQEARQSGNYKITHQEFKQLQGTAHKTPQQWKRFEDIMNELGLSEAEKYAERGSP